MAQRHGTCALAQTACITPYPPHPSSPVSLPHLLDPVVNSPSLSPLAGWTGSPRLRHAEQCLALNDSTW